MIDPTTDSLEEVFSQLSPQDEQILISLPYRVGIYVSYSDITGGWEAQERELQSLSGILREFSEDFCKTEFAQKVLMESLINRSQWPSWSQQIETVPAQAERILGVLKSMFLEKELNSFKEVLVEIALSVAMAFREDDPTATRFQNETPTGGSFVKNLVDKLTNPKKQADPLEHINISLNERLALLKLAKALQYSKFSKA